MRLPRLIFLAKHAARDAASPLGLRKAAKLCSTFASLSILFALGCAATCFLAWTQRPAPGTTFYSELSTPTCPPSLATGYATRSISLVSNGSSLRNAMLIETFQASCRMEGARPVALLTLATFASPMARHHEFNVWIAAQLAPDAASVASSWIWTPTPAPAGWTRPSLETLGLAQPSSASRAFGADQGQPPTGLSCAWSIFWRACAGLICAIVAFLVLAMALLLFWAVAAIGAEIFNNSFGPAKAWLTRSTPASLSEAEAREISESSKAALPLGQRRGRL